MDDKKNPNSPEAQLARSNELKAEAVAAMVAREKWMPTPTQEENDAHAMGKPMNKKPDGSPLEETAEQIHAKNKTRSMEAKKPERQLFDALCRVAASLEPCPGRRAETLGRARPRGRGRLSARALLFASQRRLAVRQRRAICKLLADGISARRRRTQPRRSSRPAYPHTRKQSRCAPATSGARISAAVAPG